MRGCSMAYVERLGTALLKTTASLLRARWLGICTGKNQDSEHGPWRGSIVVRLPSPGT